MVFSRPVMASSLASIAMTIGSGLIAASAMAGDAKTQTSPQTSTSVSSPNNCKVVERKPGENRSGTLSSSVTAGNGKVTASTTGGHGVTVQSGNGQASSSVATTGSGGNGTTTVTTSDGNCIIYVDPGQKKD